MNFNKNTHQQLTTAYYTFLLICISFYLQGQANGIAWTAEYTGSYNDSYQHEIDASGNLLKGLTTVTGTGKHSVLGDVTSSSIIHINEYDKNLVDFTETDKAGNSLIIRAVGRAGSDANSWGADGIITGGTGKYKGASGTYEVTKGININATTKWSAKGMLYITDKSNDIAEEGIKEVIRKETEMFYKRNFEEWSKTVVQQEYVEGIFASTPLKVARYGGYKIMKNAFQGFKGFPAETPKVNRTNWNIQVRDGVAWATFDQETIAGSIKTYSTESRILEKINNNWRIAHNTVSYDFEKSTENNLTAEEAAVRKVIADEVNYFSKADFENYSKTINYNDELAAYYVTEPGSYSKFEGAEICKTAAKGYFADPNSAYNKNVVYSNWNIRIRGNVAWATFETSSDTWGSKIKSLQIRVLEKIDGQWKIGTLVSIPNFKTANPSIKGNY